MRDSRAFRERQAKNRKTVLSDQQTFGLEKLIRIILVCTPWWVFPGNWVKVATDRCNVFTRRVLIEAYVLAKVLIFWMLIANGYSDYSWVTGLLLWLTIETLYALSGSVFLRDVWSVPFSYQRNLILTLMNYMEICLFFAAVYRYEEVNNSGGTLARAAEE
ncbi:hypothetical protein QG516_24695 [Pedobacter gandavensis]|uniref:hypothetical protein n=1 Tax=Pedobacter gandavensis TaxID=2679963 RepID=UPI0024799002|nr:hypothetical protein [Pedobacter gandavensis]WGQ09717.1 hypothetical protein QG516_24695 [Pedobacter gandavensis]